jgi:serine protease
MCHVPTGPNDLQSAECSCTKQTCGAGMANADGAVQEALRPIAAVAVAGIVQGGNPVTLDAGGSGAACQASIVSYAWSVVAPTTSPPAVIQNANSARASIVAPSSGSPSYNLMITVTDDQGRTDSAVLVLSSSGVRTTAPAAAGNNACLAAVAYSVPPPNSSASAAGGGSHGGGGALDVLTVLALAGYVLVVAATRAPLAPARDDPQRTNVARIVR